MSKNTTSYLIEAVLEGEAFEILFKTLEKVRKENPEQFVNTICAYIGKANENDFFYLLHRLKLSSEEEFSLFTNIFSTATSLEKTEIRTLIISKLQSKLFNNALIGKVGTNEFQELEVAQRQEVLADLKLSNEEISLICQYYGEQSIVGETLLPSIQWKFSGWQTIGLLAITPEPTGEELLKDTLQKIISEKKIRKPSDLERFVKSRIKKAFPKNAKPFTNEQVKEGIDWFIATRKKIANKKAITDQRSRSRVNLPNKEWNAFMLKQFGRRVPEFAKQYQKKVRDEVNKISKRQNAPS